ncbi:PREDICTED: aluminum-activated malate transporter 8-like [Tarenaya hassleriana]|uniref:aluminum-activated malate transporter 8-like n=1 Tax=Tarenaya hassleriana TaxID=28532 RepID=UPI00053C8533|nr:PREDICTED: aluminum-activated malate transporter 8-like [Tarenaya hassleriana]
MALQRPEKFPESLKTRVFKCVKNVRKLGKEDPRRVIHSMKVGVALTLASLLYYVRPLYNVFGVSGIWAVITISVVFDFTVGGTISKGVNRGFATFSGCALGVGAVHFASLFGREGEGVVITLLVFLLGAAATFSRFFPRIKQRYDYFFLIFILTFSIIAVSGYRTNEIVVMAHQRLSTILIGGTICILVNILICPVWAGEELHNLVANNIEKLGHYLEGFADEYFQTTGKISKEAKSRLQGYKSVLTSKSNEETQANLARWEPRHGRFRRYHPWEQYLKIGASVRQCAFHIEILNGYVTSYVRAPEEFKSRIQESCTNLSREAGEALKAISKSIKATRKLDPFVKTHIENSKEAIEDLRNAIRLLINPPSTLKDDLLLEIIAGATVASILIDVVKCIEDISETVEELAVKSNFDATVSPEKGQHGLLRRGIVKPVLDGTGEIDPPHVVISIDDEAATGDSPEKKSPEAMKGRVDIV